MVIFYRDLEMRAIGLTVLFSFFSFALPLRLKAQKLNNPEISYIARSSLWHTIVNNNAEANRYNKILKRHFPSFPLAYLLMAFNEISESLDFQLPIKKNIVEENLTKGRTLIDAAFGENESAENYFFKGALQSISAYYNLTEKNYLTAFTNSIDAVDYFNECLKLNPDFTEALTVIGSYRFWLNDKLKSLNLFSSNSNNIAGISLIEKGIEDKNNLLRPLGFESLIWIYIHQKKINKAVKIAEKALRVYPYSRFFLDALAHAYSHGNKLQAVEKFRLLLRIYNSSGRNVDFQKVLIGSKIALNLFALNRFNEALDECNKVLKIKVKNKSQVERAENRKAKMEHLKKLIVKKLMK